MKTAPRWLLSIVRIVVSLILVYLCLYFVDFEKLKIAIKQTDTGLFATAFLLNIFGNVIIRSWIAYLTTSASGLRLGYLQLLQINISARFYTIALPRGAAAAIRWYRYSDGGSGHAAAALLIFENLLLILTLFLSAGIILLYEGENAGDIAEFLLPLSWLGTVAVVGMLLPFLYKPSGVFLEYMLQPLCRRSIHISSFFERLLEAVTVYQKISASKIASICFFSIFSYSMFIFSAWVLAESMALGVGFLAIAWVRSITLLIALLPITIAGIGLREGVIIVLLQGYGVNASAAFAYALASFGIQLIIAALGAIIEAYRVFIRKQDAQITPKSGDL